MEETNPPPWLIDLDVLAEAYTNAGEAYDVFQPETVRSNIDDDRADLVCEERRAVQDEMMQLVAEVRDVEIAQAYLATEGTGPRADALCFIMKRRHINF